MSINVREEPLRLVEDTGSMRCQGYGSGVVARIGRRSHEVSGG